MTNPEWFPLATAAATALAALVAAVVALRSADLSSRTTFQSSYTKDRLDVVGRFLDSVDAVLDDPTPDTRARVKSEFLRVRVVFHPGGPPVHIAKQITAAVENLAGKDELNPSEEERMLHKLRDDVQRETAMIEERGDDAEPALGWVLEEVMKLRAEDDQAVKDGRPESDREQELHMIESDLVGLGKPGWLQVGVVLGSAQRREMLGKLRQRDQEARHAMDAGREEFVTAAGDWLAGPPALDGPRGTVRVLPGTRWYCRLRLLRSRS
ncbi:hypothetical protein ACWD3J_36710 [Streptomyces sp. NPDC002755]|uniref:hypothetical protein n=1 Tax=Streptomyces sp. NPDC002884 TaxID=3154544 RepID=UPI00331C56F9